MPESTKFKNQYRIKTIRLPNWNYENPGFYFVTICTKNFRPYFGTVEQGSMVLTQIGQVVEKIWLCIPNQFPIRLDTVQIMPNHLHGIIILNDTPTSKDSPIVRDAMNRVSTGKPTAGGITGNDNPMLQSCSLSSIIRWLKGRATFEIHQLFPKSQFAWQPRFYEHIIRTEKSYLAIQNYIRNNPLKWHLDELNVPGY